MSRCIERAGEALETAVLAGGRVLNPPQARDAARVSFESINPHELAIAIADDFGFPNKIGEQVADSVINHLLGENAQ